MKKTSAILCAVLLALVSPSGAQFIDLVSLGSASYTIEPSVSSGSYTQGTTGVTYAPSVVLGDSVGGTFNASPLDWSSFSDLASAAFLQISITGPNPNVPMTLEIFNSTLTDSVKYQGSTDPAAFGTAVPYFRFTLIGTNKPAVLASVGGAQITWDGDATINANIQGIATVPEPSTYALLAISGLAFGGYVIRRRRAA